MKVAILGSTGMLGSMVRRYLSEQPGYELTCPSSQQLHAELVTYTQLSSLLHGYSYVINCIGVTKPRINELDHASVGMAVRVNSLFPQLLACAAELKACRVLQIATDCVFSGATGAYTESSLHDATDVYGKTKSLGEVCSPNVHHLRCSIIGPEMAGRPKDSLLEWFLGQPQNATVKGYTNHNWNGITTLAFAKICHGIMSQGIELPHVQHVIPMNTISKFLLLTYITEHYKRFDIQLDQMDTSVPIERTLTTTQHDLSRTLWLAAGYKPWPGIYGLVQELEAYGRGNSQ